MKHEAYQNSILPMLKKSALLTEDASLIQVAEILLDTDRTIEAVELLFATNRYNGFFSRDALGWSMFLRCTIEGTDLLREVTRNHKWSDNDNSRGFSMQIYPGEWLTILEPTASRLLAKMM